MVRRVLKRIPSFMKAAGDFVMHLLHTPKEESTPDPAKAAAKRVGEAMHATRGSSGFGTSGTTEPVYGQQLADGHKKSR